MMRGGDVSDKLTKKWDGGVAVANLQCTTHGLATVVEMLCHLPCRPRGQQWRQPCASHQRRTRQDNGGSHPSYIERKDIRTWQ